MVKVQWGYHRTVTRKKAREETLMGQPHHRHHLFGQYTHFFKLPYVLARDP